jgi:predicted amidohydrolase
MKLSIAQLKPVKGNISANIEKHRKLINLAVSLDAAAIFFPELSLTSYEPELAKELATNLDDRRLTLFQETSDRHTITIGVGLPTKSPAGIRISMLIFQPNQVRQTYSKQQLHSDELPYFVAGNGQLLVTVDAMSIAPAICYESLQPDHSDHACKLGAQIYLASVAKSQNGVDKAMIHYPEVAKKYAMPVLMSNSVGFCDNFMSAGQSSVWTKRGLLVDQLDQDAEGILVFDTENEEVMKRTI